MTADDAPLTAGFEVPGHGAWRRKVEGDLPGRGLADLSWETDDGVRFAPLYERGDLAGLPHLGAASRLLRRAHPPAIRQWIDAATPERAAQHVADALRGGADELLLQFDRLARHGVDPGTLDEADAERDLYAFDAGHDGCAIYHLDALDRALPVDLAGTRIALDAGTAGLQALGMLLALADRRGVPRAALRIELGLDPLGESAAGRTRDGRGAWPGLDAAVRHLEDVPGLVPVAVHSAPYHRAGAAPAQELALTIAAGIGYVRRLLRDLTPERACRAVTFRFRVDTSIYLEVAKLRAARLLWAKVARAFGASDPRTTIQALGSDRSLSGDDAHTNLLRTGIQAFGADLGGADSIALPPFRRTHDERDAAAQTLARNQLLLLREESHLHEVEDPTAGAYAVEALTDALAREAWAMIQAADGADVAAALRAGAPLERLQAAALRRRARFRTRRSSLVGTTRYVDPRFATEETGDQDAAAIGAGHARHLATRGPLPPPERGAALDPVAAMARGYTLGEVDEALRSDAAVAAEPPLLALPPDGAEFEELRRLVRAAALRVLPVLSGPAGWSRAREAFARDYFLAGGFEVLPAVELHEATDLAAQAPDIVVLCSDDDSYATLAPRARGDHLLIVAGRPQAALEATVDGFVHAGDDTYLTLRHLYLHLSPPSEGDDT